MQQQQQRADGIATATPTMRARPLANINNITNITPSEHPPSRLNQAQGPAPANLPPLRKLMSTPITDLHPDDDSDHVLPVIFAILDRGGNRAMSVKELGEAAFNQSLMRTRSVFSLLFFIHFSRFFITGLLLTPVFEI
jgi:hypothetical protein